MANSSFTLPSISFDNGLVELSALTTLFSSSAAASLALGSRGPAGLAWAATSAFGIIVVAIACLSAATPGWFCETTGVRSVASDWAVGFLLDLRSSSYSSKRVRKTLDRPIAIQSRGHIGNNSNPSKNTIGNDIYAYDYSTSAMINNVPDTLPGEPTRIFSYAIYGFRRKHDKRVQIGAIFLSLSKFIEFYVFWRNDSKLLAIITCLPSCHFLMFAIITELIALKRAKYPETKPGIVDILAGKLPAVKQAGGSRKIIIGASQNPKHTILWTIMWSLGVALCASSVVLTYIILGWESKRDILIWIEFQASWMGIRMLVCHLIPPDDPLANRQLAEHSLASLSQDIKERIMRLTMALSKHQTYSHPRGDYCYPYDCFGTSDILSFISRHASTYPTHSFIANSTRVQISIKAVIGDTTLSSASWIAGSNLTPMELYDSCVVVFNMNEASPAVSSTLAIPAVRVLSGRPFGQAPDPEKAGTASFTPKGASNDGYDIWWLYWIPLASGRWIFLETPDDSLDIRQQRMGNLMSSQGVTEQLAAGKFNIGLKCVEHVQAALEASRKSFLDLQAISSKEKGKN